VDGTGCFGIKIRADTDYSQVHDCESSRICALSLLTSLYTTILQTGLYTHAETNIINTNGTAVYQN